MKNILKRSLALLLVLALFVSMTVMASAATVEYVTGNPEPVSSSDAVFTNVIANWGTREETATFRSPNAIKTYGPDNEFYQEVTTACSNGQELYMALQKYMTDRHKTITDYSDTRALYAYTDCQESRVGAISSFYSGLTIGPEWDSGKTWNREHTWPNSKGLAGDDENDIMMLRPTEKSENGNRSNKAYGESSGYYDPNSVSGGKHNLHGDVARIVLYIYVRWGNSQYLWGKSGVMESKEVLLKWMEEDPVDTWELGRNDSVESITGVRNVFVDYPELAFLLFDEEIPSMVTPSGLSISYVAEISGVGYTTVKEALRNAQAGDTVTLMTDVSEPESNLMIDENVTLDLAGYDLTVKSLNGLTGSCLNATRYGNADHGRLFVEQGRLSLTEAIKNGENEVIPYWDPYDGCYVLANTRIKDVDNAFTVDEANKTVSFRFSYGAGAAANETFLSDGADDNAMSFIVRLEWESENGIAYQDFVYKNTYVETLAKSGGNFTFELTGYDVLNIDLDTFSITGMILTDAGIVVSGTEYR